MGWDGIGIATRIQEEVLPLSCVRMFKPDFLMDFFLQWGVIGVAFVEDEKWNEMKYNKIKRPV